MYILSGRPKNDLFSPHIQIAHEQWAKHLQPGDSVVDATCGNGQDLVVLAKLILPREIAHSSAPLPKLFAYDVQASALANAQHRARQELTKSQLENICWLERCHSQIGEVENAPLALVVYNLGYLPGGDKRLVSSAETTVPSLQLAMQTLAHGGAISITCYPRHLEGQREWLAVRAWAQTLDSKCWSICEHSWLNRPLSPVWFWAQKKAESIVKFS